MIVLLQLNVEGYNANKLHKTLRLILIPTEWGGGSVRPISYSPCHSQRNPDTCSQN